jgi:hypothetical protein
MQTLTTDAEFKDLIPPLDADELAQLEANLVADGCREAIVAWDGVIIDGHNRYAICERLGIPYGITEREFNDRSEAVEWIIRNQFGRRNINAFTRGQLALRLESVIAAKAKANQQARKGDQPGTTRQNSAHLSKNPVKTRDEIAKIAGVSHDTIAKVKRITNEGDTATIEAAKAGSISINAAHEHTAKSQLDDYDEQLARMRANCGDPFADAVKDGVTLRTVAHFRQFAALSDDDQKGAGKQVLRGWKIGDAVRFAKNEVTMSSDITELVARVESSGRQSGGWDVNGWRVSIQKL